MEQIITDHLKMLYQQMDMLMKRNFPSLVTMKIIGEIRMKILIYFQDAILLGNAQVDLRQLLFWKIQAQTMPLR